VPAGGECGFLEEKLMTALLSFHQFRSDEPLPEENLTEGQTVCLIRIVAKASKWTLAETAEPLGNSCTK